MGQHILESLKGIIMIIKESIQNSIYNATELMNIVMDMCTRAGCKQFDDIIGIKVDKYPSSYGGVVWLITLEFL